MVKFQRTEVRHLHFLVMRLLVSLLLSIIQKCSVGSDLGWEEGNRE